eukprot:2061661-Amphidinium_carterae.1
MQDQLCTRAGGIWDSDGLLCAQCHVLQSLKDKCGGLCTTSTCAYSSLLRRYWAKPIAIKAVFPTSTVLVLNLQRAEKPAKHIT